MNSEEGVQQVSQYQDMKSHPGWAAHQQFLMLVIEKIGNDMLSQKFTNLDPTQKDVQQRVYSQMFEVIKFLIDPLKMAEPSRKITKHNKQMEATFGSDQKGK